jgi:hypothetical protein
MKRAIFGFLMLFLATARCADAASIRVAVRAEADNNLSSKLVSLLSKEMRGLHQVVVSMDSPQYRLSCSVITLDLRNARGVGYAASVVVTSADGHLLMHFVHADTSLESLAHEVALAVDGGILESARRENATPSEKPQ